MIGWKCKYSNIFSRPVLIGRGLDHEKKDFWKKVVLKTFTLCIFECAKVHYKDIGNDEIGGTPVPIPNTEVKPYDAEDTLNESLGENMGLPIFLYNLA